MDTATSSKNYLPICRNIQLALMCTIVVTYFVLYFYGLASRDDRQVEFQNIFVNVNAELISEMFSISGINNRTKFNSSHEDVCFQKKCVPKCCSEREGFVSADDLRCTDNMRYEPDQFFETVTFKLENSWINSLSEAENESSLYYYTCDQDGSYSSRYEERSYRKLILENDSLDNVDYISVEVKITCVDFVTGTGKAVPFVSMGCGVYLPEISNQNDTLTNKGNNVQWPSNQLVYVLLVIMTLSILCLLAVIAVYMYLPEMRNLHGKLLVCYMVSGIFFHPTLMASFFDEHFSQMAALLIGELCHLAFQLSLTWLAILCFDMWSRFSRSLQLRKTNSGLRSRKFLYYSIVGWGWPITTFFIDWSLLDNSLFFIMTLNFVMFVSTLINIRLQRRFVQQDQLLPSNHYEGILIFVKLSLLMGFDLFLFYISTFFMGSFTIVVLFVLESQGIFLFVFLVCNSRIWNLLQKKWRENSSEYNIT